MDAELPKHDSKDARWLSRSALAEKLDIPLKKITQLMVDSGWIKHEHGRWILTAKGEFEGGEYRNSKKYGEYIVWPDGVTAHAIFTLDDADTSISARELAQRLSLPVRLLNSVFCELGWIKPLHKGWALQSSGLKIGAIQQEHDKTGIPYVLWPKTVFDNAELRSLVKQLDSGVSAAAPEAAGADVIGLDGHGYKNLEVCRLANWLYLNRIVFAVNRLLPHSEKAQVSRAAFYLPDANLYVDLNTAAISPKALADLIERQRCYQEEQLDFIEMGSTDWAVLDTMLPKELLLRGIEL